MIGPDKNLRVNSNAAKQVIGSRRRNLLAGSAFAGGVFALMLAANPQSAMASCVVATGTPNIVNCNTATATINVTNTNAGVNPSIAREQLFTIGGDVNAEVQPGIAITRRGLAIDTTVAGAAINFINEGSISTLAPVTPPLVGGNAVLNLTTNNGNINYIGNGSVTDNGNGFNAIQTSSGNGSTSLLVGGIITSQNNAINAAATGGNVNISITGAAR